MKLLLCIALAIAALTVDCVDKHAIQDGLIDSVEERQQKGKPSDELQEGNADEIDSQLQRDSLDMTGNPEPLSEEEEGHDERLLQKGSCKARNACVVLGGFCVTNTTLCSGRLVAEGCKPRGSNCTCCVPGTIESKLHNLEMELQFMKDNITDELMNKEAKLDSIKDHQAEACYSPGFSCAFGEGTCRPNSCNSTTEHQNGTCGGVGCKCCKTKLCYTPGSSCASGQGTCRPDSCNSTTEDQSGTCGGASCKCCKTKPCYSPGSSCASGQGTCRVNSCLSTEDQNGTCGGASCMCCNTKICHSPGSSCASGLGTCRANSCNSNEEQSGTCGGSNCKCCRLSCLSAGGTRVAGQCLFFEKAKKTWEDSIKSCRIKGLRLASIQDPTAFVTYMKRNFAGEWFWLGGSDSANEGRWIWLNGNTFVGFPWESVQPDDKYGNQDCLLWGWHNTFDDNICTRTYRYICEL